MLVTHSSTHVRGPPQNDDRMTCLLSYVVSTNLTRLAKVFAGVYLRIVTWR